MMFSMSITLLLLSSCGIRNAKVEFRYKILEFRQLYFFLAFLWCSTVFHTLVILLSAVRFVLIKTL